MAIDMHAHWTPRELIRRFKLNQGSVVTALATPDCFVPDILDNDTSDEDLDKYGAIPAFLRRNKK
mgnify:CR=1 FL=1